MGSTGQRLFLFTTLGVGYYIYRNALREVIFQNQNTFLNSPLLSQLRSQNYTIVGQNRVLIGNPVNKTYDSSRERIIIIGGGVIGLSTAYYLAKLKKYDVILLEKNDTFTQSSAQENGGVLCPSQCYPQTTTEFFLEGLKSFTTGETSIKFSFKMFIERYFTIWFSNYLLNMNNSANLQGTKKLANLASAGMEEIHSLNQEIEFQEMCNMTSKGTIQVFSDPESKKSQIELLRDAGISIKELDKYQLAQLEPALKTGLEKFEYGYVGSADTNININNFTNKIAQISEINGVTLFTGAEFHRFLFHKESNKMIGVITSQGIILCDKVVVASGIKSKDIAHKLGVRLPLLSFKQYSAIANIPENKTLSHTIVDDKTKTYVSPLASKYLISGLSDFGYDVETIDDDRVQYLIRGTKTKIGEFDTSRMDVWASTKALSADDVPIIGQLPQYENIYVNTGHGNKGLTLALGSGKLMSEIIDSRARKEVEEDFSLDRFYLI